MVACSKPETYIDEIYEKPAINPDPPAPALSPKESMETMYLPKGFTLELVASEPMIKEPVAIAWDGDGKMYVAEMRTYMQDIDGTDENKPWSRVSLLEDTNGDGKMDKHSIFVDSLLLPRNLLPLDDRVIISETYSNNFWSYRDTDGDGVADEKLLIYEDSTRFRGNLEHQSANLTWNMDNHMYLSRGPFRYSWDQGKLKRDTILDPPDGQYGLTQDETGKNFYSRAGGEQVAVSFQQHAVYGGLELEGRWEEGFEEPWPIIGTPDVQGGTRRLRPDNTLNKFTAVSGQEVFLGNRLPAYGDLFIPEPVGRLIRRAHVKQINGQTVLSSVYPKVEFMASTDPNFRPVMAKTGPDGCLYVVDMYRGIIQEGNWVREGSYLRPEVERRNLDKNVSRGRIYRIVHDQMEPDKPIKLLHKSSDDLLDYLGHANGWYRQTAQKLLVVREDKSVVPALKSMLKHNETFFQKMFNSEKDFGIERLHALWTLEGLDEIDKTLLHQKFQDSDPRIRCAAIRLSEKYLEAGDKEMFGLLAEMKTDTSKEVVAQVVLSLKKYRDKNAGKEEIQKIVQLYPNNKVIAASSIILPKEIEVLRNKFATRSKGTRDMIVRGYDIYKGLCATCHGKDAKGMKDLGPSLADSPRMMGENLETPVKILLDGLAGPVDGKDYGIMVPMKSNDDQWIADVLTYVRENFQYKSRISSSRVKRVREKYANRDRYWTIKELEREAGK